MNKEIFIIGSGPGDLNELTKRAEKTIANCDEVYAFDRLGELFKSCREDIVKCSLLDIEEKIIHSSSHKTAVLVSGDVGFFSLAKILNEKFQNKFTVSCVCGINSLQYFCAKININYDFVRTVSLHGRESNLLGSIAYNRYTFVLTGGENNASFVLKDLVTKGLSDVKVIVGEMLSSLQERIIKGTVEELSNEVFDSLTVLLFENKNFISREDVLFDRELSRNETPMTKQEVRWVSINMLNIKSNDILFDIGAGSGSVAIEMGRKAFDGLVYAIEKDTEAFELLDKNKSQLGAFNIIPVFGEAMEEIKKLPIPDKAFIGGSGGNLESIIKYLYQINEDIRIIVTAITLETLSIAVAAFKEINFDMEVTCLNCAKNKKIEGYDLMIANNPVYILKGENHGK